VPKALKAPFPWFGGKRKIAGLVWGRLGDPDNYVEPFMGSCAVLLMRPTPPRIETVNDIDCYVSNFFRATQHDPEKVAEYADYPVVENCLHARHRWLVLSEHAAEFRKRMRTDPDYYDAKVAGWWCWGLCCWIGAGWSVAPEDGPGHGPHGGSGERLPSLPGSGGQAGVHARGEADVPAAKDLQSKARIGGDNKGSVGKGVHAGGPGGQLPAIGRGGDGRGPGSGMKGVHQDLPDEHAGGGPSEKLPKLAGGGRTGDRAYGGSGVHQDSVPDSHRPQLADAYAAGRGVHAGPQGGGLSEQRPDLGGIYGYSGRHVHSQEGNAGPQGGGLSQQVPNIGTGGHGDGTQGVHRTTGGGTCAARRAWLLDWFGRLRDRLRCTRVCCGSWERVCSSESVTTRLGTTGIFFDCPYRIRLKDGTQNRTAGIYGSDGGKCVVDDVIAYCVERGSDPRMRIAACCYEGEGYEVLADHGWDVVAYKASGGYGNRSKKGKDNAARERIWFSPFCHKERTLFDGVNDGRD
jgi:hypothetical protein